MNGVTLIACLFLVLLNSGCRNAAQDVNDNDVTSGEKLSVSTPQIQVSKTPLPENTERISRRKVENDRRIFLQKILDEKLFQPSQEVLLRFSQVCELTFPGESLDVVEIETFNLIYPNNKLNHQTIIFNRDKTITEKLSETAPLSCDGNKLYTSANAYKPAKTVLVFNKLGKVASTENDTSERATVYTDLKIKPVPVVRKKVQEKDIDEQQTEYQIDGSKFSQTRLNNRTEFLAEAIKEGFSQLKRGNRYQFNLLWYKNL